jgi:hypothetical protein
MAELRPIPTGRLLGELDATLRSLPALTNAEADSFAADMALAHAQLPPVDARDPWQS